MLQAALFPSLILTLRLSRRHRMRAFNVSPITNDNLTLTFVLLTFVQMDVGPGSYVALVTPMTLDGKVRLLQPVVLYFVLLPLPSSL